MRRIGNIRWRYVFGIEGIADDDRLVARILFYIFHTVILVIAIWLPFQRYLVVEHMATHTADIILIWIFFAIFVLEVLLCFGFSNQRWKYLGTNWLSIIIMLVLFPILWNLQTYEQVVHFFRVVVLIYLLLPWSHTVARLLGVNFLAVTLALIVIIAVLAGLFLTFAEPNIGTPWNGIWWSFQTIATVGYGDIVPDTYLGQLLSMIFMMLSTGLLAVLAASFTVRFIYRDKPAKNVDMQKVLQEMQEVTRKLNDLEQKMGGSGKGEVHPDE